MKLRVVQILRISKSFIGRLPAATLISVCALGVLSVSVVRSAHLESTAEAQRGRAATKLAVGNFGSAAGCEAMAVPRRYLASSSLGCAPGSGFAPQRNPADLWAEPEPGAQPKWKSALTARHSHRLTSGGEAVTKKFVKKTKTSGLVTPRALSPFAILLQGPELDYSNFKHTSQRHASIACDTCHQRSDNSATPRFPGHKACTSCHLAQFVTPNVPMCVICHTNVNSSNPPLKSFPARFNESFNVKFDHAQHMSGAARPQSGCAACHSRTGGRAAALGIPAGIAAHNQCYSCHTPSSRSASGREIASCGVCHDQKSYARTTINARAFRYAFSHAKHGPAQRLACADCHRLTAGAPQSRQVSSPAVAEHFPTVRGQGCLTCHNGQRSFGGDLAFKDCRRCHTSGSFKVPL